MPEGISCIGKNAKLDFAEKIHRFQQIQITRFVLAVIVANSNAIFPNNNANPAIVLMTWNPRGIVITPKIAIPNIIAGNIRFRFRLRASPFPKVLFLWKKNQTNSTIFLFDID